MVLSRRVLVLFHVAFVDIVFLGTLQTSIRTDRRMGGNATAENPKEAKPKPAKEKGNAVDADAKGPKKAKRSGGKKSKFKR